MSFSLTRSDRRILIVVGLLAVGLTTITALISPDDNLADVPTTYSSGSGGAKAAYLLLRANGYTVSRWERPLSKLPMDGRATLVLAEPQTAATIAERRALERFVRAGGHLIITGPVGAFFVNGGDLLRDRAGGLTWQRLDARAPSPITTAAPTIAMATPAAWPADADVVVLYGSAPDRAHVVKYAVGKGEVLWWSAATPVTNAGLSEPGNLEFVLASLGDPSRPILWDEYSHGYTAATDAPEAGPLAGTPLPWIGAQSALIVVAVLLTYSRRSGPTIPARTESRLSPLEFVRTLGALYQRAGATVAVDISYLRFRSRLARRLGVPPATTDDTLASLARSRWPIADGLDSLLRRCDAARRDATLSGPAALALTRALAIHARQLDLGRT